MTSFKQPVAMGNVNLRQPCLLALGLHEIGQPNNQESTDLIMLHTNKLIDSEPIWREEMA